MFTASGINYCKALELIRSLEQQNISANITVGGVAIRPLPNQVNKAKEICSQMGASFEVGYSRIQEDTLIQGGNIDEVARVTNNAISIIKEWE